MTDSPLLPWYHAHRVPLTSWMGQSWPVQCSDPQAEYRAVQERAGLSDGSLLGILQISGRDRATFLQGLVTNNILTLQPGQACWACTLTPTGHVTSLCLIVCRVNELWVIAPRPLLPLVRAHCEQYLIMEAVELSDQSESWTALGLQGPQSTEVLRRVLGTAADCTSMRWHDATWDGQPTGVLGHEPFGVPGCLWWVPTAHAVAAWEACIAAGATPMGLLASQTVRVEAGVPWYGIDVDATHLLPETGWERTATSYTKGCYVGQEIVARVAHRGQAMRHLAGVAFEGEDLPAVPCELQLDEQPCGRVTSAVYSPKLQRVVGIGLIARRAWAPGATLRLTNTARTATLFALPQLPLPG